MSAKKKIFNDYTQSTTLHGINHCFDKDIKTCIRLVWVLMLSATIAIFLNVLVNGCIKYLEYPVATRVIHTQDTYGSSMMFPSITICPLNYISLRAVSQPPFHMTKFLPSGFPDMSDPQTVAVLSAYDFGELLRMTAPQIDVFRQCIWQEVVLNCSNFLTVRNTEKGVCYTFHSAAYISAHDEFLVTDAGYEQGLMLTLDTQVGDYIMPTTNGVGFKVQIHSPYEEPRLNDDGFYVTPGNDYQVKITKQEKIGLPPPYENSTCIDDGKRRFENPQKYFRHLSREACRQDCRLEFIRKQCNCTPMYFEPAAYTNVCDFPTLLTCVNPAEDDFGPDDSGQCKDRCASASKCHEIIYQTGVSNMALRPGYPAPTGNGGTVSGMINETKEEREEYIMKNYIEMSIFVSDLSYISIESYPAYTFADLGADIGSYLGLCVGASVLTFCEFLDFLMKLISACLYKQHLDTQVEDLSKEKEARLDRTLDNEKE